MCESAAVPGQQYGRASRLQMHSVCAPLTPLHNTHFILLCMLELINCDSEL
jgi:hypothetical protein